MRVPRQFRKEPAIKFSTPEVRYIKAGCYPSIDGIMDAIMKSATGKSKEKILSPDIQQNKDAPSHSTNISWKVDKTRHKLSVKYYGNVEKHGLVIQAVSQDLKNILGMTTIIDCQNAEQRQKSNNTVDGKFHDDQQNNSELTVVKKTLDIGQLTSMLEVTQCFYTATWFRMRHWATHKLRCCGPFPSTAFFNEPIQKRDEPQELFKFAVEKNLQITIPINHSDFGQRKGSEDAFPELWSNKHYFGT